MIAQKSIFGFKSQDLSTKATENPQSLAEK
jgi:hypothetical protein